MATPTTPPPVNVPLTIVAGTLPPGAVYNPQTYFNAIVARMTATIQSGNIMWGQLGGTEPNSPLPGNDDTPGLWFGDPEGGDGYWNSWNTTAYKYLPARNVCGQYVNATLRTTDFVCGAVTADTTITTPDESGTLALTSDLVNALGLQTFGGTSVHVDVSDRRAVYVVLSGATTITFTGT
ncbi:MAG: hypothetical protein C5B54_06330, partial [Acidobacteria bacterium]